METEQTQSVGQNGNGTGLIRQNRKQNRPIPSEGIRTIPSEQSRTNPLESGTDLIRWNGINPSEGKATLPQHPVRINRLNTGSDVGSTEINDNTAGKSLSFKPSKMSSEVFVSSRVRSF